MPTLPPVTQQYLFGIDIMETPNVWAYKIDNQTGALTEMPWSPFQTHNHGISATADPTGKFIHIYSEAPLAVNNDPSTLETFAISDNPPVPVDRQAAPYSRTLAFDPQQKFFYIANPFSGIAPPNTIQGYSLQASGVPLAIGPRMPVDAAFISSYAYKTAGNLLLLAHGTDSGAQKSRNGITVFRQTCSSGVLTLLTDNILPDGPVLLSAPKRGDLVVGWNANASPARTWVYKVDGVTGSLTQYPNGFIQGLQRVSFSDPLEEFAVGIMANDPNLAGQPYDTVVVYRVSSVHGFIETDRYVLPALPNGVAQNSTEPVFDATGNFVYVSSVGRLNGFRLDRQAGKLSQLPSFPISNSQVYSPVFVSAQR